MTADYSTGQLTDLLFYPETTEIGYGPVQDSSTWAAQHTAGNAYRVRCTGFPVESLVRSVVPDPDMSLRLTETHKPILGNRSTADVGFTTKAYGAEAETSGGSQVAVTALMKMVEWSLGGLERNNTTTVSGAPGSDVSFTLDSATNFAAGQLLGLEDGDDLDRVFMRRVESLSGADVTTHADLDGWNLADEDNVHGFATGWINPAGLYRGGGNYKTLSVLVIKNGLVWELRGCKLVIDQVNWGQNTPATINWRLMVGCVVPPGNSPSAPTLTAGDPEGGAGLATGIDMYFHDQDFGTTTHNGIHVMSATLNPGLTVTRQTGITSANQYIDGMSSFVCGRLAPPTLQIGCFVDTDHHADFEALTDKVLSLYQVAAPGSIFGCHAAKAVLQGDPPATVDVNKQYNLTYQLREDSVVDSDLGRSPFLLGIG